MVGRCLVLVALVACGHPARPIAPEPDREPDDAQQAFVEPPHPEAPFEPPDPTCEISDVKNPACRVCPDPPDVEILACQRTMPCPNPPDRRVKHCFPQPLPDGIVLARILALETLPDGAVITISAGSKHGIDLTWHGAVLAGDTDNTLAPIVWLRIDRVVSRAMVHLSADQIEKNPRVRLTR